MCTSEEEDVGDHMIHRRQEHSEYYRAMVTSAEPFWRVHRFSTRGARSALTKTLVLIELWHVDRALKHNIMQYVLDLSLHINGGSRCFHKMDSCVEDQNMQSEQCDPVSQLHSSFSSAVQTALYNAATIGRQLCVCVMNRHASLECSNCCYATTEKRVRRRALCWSLHTLRLEHFDFLRAAALWVRGRVSEPPNT